jgi:hypothetical protein
MLLGTVLFSGASGTTVSPCESFASRFSPLVLEVPFVTSEAEARAGTLSPLLSVAGALVSASSLTNLSKAGRLASGWSLREGEEASSRGLLADWVVGGEADIVGVSWTSRLNRAACSSFVENVLNFFIGLLCTP